VYGKSRSPDLETGKVTYPLACFLETATVSDRERFDQLKQALPATLREIRELLYRTGTLRSVARSMDGFRRAIHREIAALGDDAATHRLLLLVIDQLVEGVYTPKPVAETATLREPRSGFHAHVRQLAADWEARLRPLGGPSAPPLVPWHNPQWTYDKDRGVIFYPDIEGLPEETLPFQASLLGEPDLDVVAQLVWRQAPALVAHELFHHYRDARGLLGSDMWHEELVANTLAIAYTARYEPDSLAAGLALANSVLTRPGNDLSPEAASIVAELLDPARAERPNTGYCLDPYQGVLAQLAMIRELAKAPEDVATAMQRWLGVGAQAA